MKYTFDIVGVSPMLHFFNHQYTKQEQSKQTGVSYIGSYKCTLDALLLSLEEVPAKWGWNQDEVVDAVIQFWMNNPDSVRYWSSRLQDAGKDNLLVARIADIQALRSELNSLLGNS